MLVYVVVVAGSSLARLSSFIMSEKGTHYEDTEWAQR